MVGVQISSRSPVVVQIFSRFDQQSHSRADSSPAVTSVPDPAVSVQPGITSRVGPWALLALLALLALPGPPAPPGPPGPPETPYVLVCRSFLFPSMCFSVLVMCLLLEMFVRVFHFFDGNFPLVSDPHSGWCFLELLV